MERWARMSRAWAVTVCGTSICTLLPVSIEASTVEALFPWTEPTTHTTSAERPPTGGLPGSRPGGNYLMVGTYGIAVNSHPGTLTGPVDRYIDPSIDFQYERPFGANLLD